MLLEVFKSIDTDNSGKIDKHEFREFLPKLYEILGLEFAHVTDNQSQIIFNSLDADGDGELDFDEIKE